MIAFVTGASGFLGVNLAAELIAQGWDVIALHRPTSDLTYLRRFPVRMVEGAVEDKSSLERAMPQAVDAVFHVAGDVNFWAQNNARQTRTNVDGTRNVVEVALARGAKKFIHTSTSSVYGFNAIAVDESAPFRGRDSWFNYLRTKVMAEDEVRKGVAAGLDATMINPSRVIGRYDRSNWARLILMAAADKLPRVPPGGGSFCHGAEVARAHIAAVTQGRRGENYLLGGADGTFKELVEIVGELLGRDIDSRTVPAPLLKLAGSVLGGLSYITRKEPMITPEGAAMLGEREHVRSDKATRDLGYRPIPLRAMLQDCVDWLREERLLKT